MRIKLNLLLLVLVVLTIFLLNGCGENTEQKSSKKEAAQVAEPTLDEQENMHNVIRSVLWAAGAYAIEHQNRWPATKMEVDEYRSKPLEGYDVKYEITEKDGKVAEFSITVFNPTKTHMVSFESACYKEKNCVEAYTFTSDEKLLADSQIRPVE